jgi:hypothetical protein
MICVDIRMRNPADFALWKVLTILPFVLCGKFLLFFPFSQVLSLTKLHIFFVQCAKEGEPFWESPCGRERPRWHIDWSAMSGHYLGQPWEEQRGGRCRGGERRQREEERFQGEMPTMT